MKRDESKWILEMMRDRDARSDAERDAVNMAIEALAAEPCEDNFEQSIHNMFDHIWNCEIDHPVFQDTVGDLMKAVMQAHKQSKPQPEPLTMTDGTMFIDVPDVTQIKRVIATETGTKFCRTFYMDGKHEPQWIPCSERLPENSNVVLCSIPADGEYVERIAFCYYQSFGNLGWRKSDWLQNIGKYGAMRPEPVAWMPLPQPYKGKE